MKRAFVVGVALLFLASCSTARYAQKQKETVSKLKKIAVIEFVILPPACDAMHSSVLAGIYSGDETNLYPEILEFHKQSVDAYSEFAGEFLAKHLSAQVLYGKKLYESKAYRSLPGKDIAVYPLDLRKSPYGFKQIATPAGCYNFFDLSKGFEVFLYGNKVTMLDQQNSYSTESSGDNPDAILKEKTEKSLAAACRALDVDAVAVVSTGLISKRIDITGSAYRLATVSVLMYDVNGKLIVDLKGMIDEGYGGGKGKLADFGHYRKSLRNFEPLFMKLVDEMFPVPSLSSMIYEGNTEEAKRMIENGADINACDRWGWTPLMMACYYNHDEIVRLLLAKGAKPDIQSKYIFEYIPQGSTALMLSAYYSCDGFVRLLLEHKADKKIKNDDGLMAEDYAKMSRSKKTCDLLKD